MSSSSSLDDALEKAAKSGNLNKDTGLNVTKAGNFTEDTSSTSNPTVSNNGGVISAYSAPSETYKNNSELVGLFDDESSLLLNRGISNRYDNDWFNNYSRYGFIDPYNTTKKTKEYLFFTRPDLHLLSSSGDINEELLNSSSFFQDAITRYPHCAEMLQYSSNTNNNNPFTPLLTNAVNSSLDLPAIDAEYIYTGQNVYGTRINYRGSSFKADYDFDFSLEFKDSKFLDVYMYFKMYDEYERLKWMGQVSPPNMQYIMKKVLHDQTSIYKIITAEDGMTILYFARVVGVTPSSVPRDSMSNLEGELTFNVSFKGQFVYDMDPRILTDFNRISQTYRTGTKNLPLFNTDTKTYDGRWAKCPYIVIRSGTTDTLKRNKYYLMWAI
jgi:hypothetical protein